MMREARIMKRLLIGLIVASYMLPVSLRGAERFIELKAKKFSYTPNIIHVDKGDTVKIRMVSEDVTHGFYLDGYGVEMRSNPGEAGSVSFVADKSGRYSFRCSVTCGVFHPYMIGYLYVGTNTRFYMYSALILIILGVSVFLVLKTKGNQEIQEI